MNSMKSFVALLISFASIAQGLTLDEYLSQVKQKNRLFSSYDLSIQASEARREAGDLALAPILSAGYTLTRDKTQPSALGPDRQITDYTLGIKKNFSTGTAISLTGQADEFDYAGPVPPATRFATGSLGVSLKQSLWKDFFGAATRLRRERESAVSQAETLALELRKRALLIEAESGFWDYAVALENLNLKKENFDRSKKLSSWTSNRVSNGISDRSDLMSIRALNSLRELELSTAADDLKVQELRIRQNLDLAANEPTPPIQIDEAVARPYFAEMANKKNILKIESYLTSLEAKSRALVAREVKDSLRPDLSLVGGYNTSTYDPQFSEVQKNMTKTEFPKTFIGVTFSWMFDTDAKRAQVEAAEKEALAAQYNSDRNKIIGRDAWLEHVRRYEVAKKSVATLQKIAEYQRERAKAEQDKFSKGRTVTLNVVTAETDAAVAEVTYVTAKSNLRKLEASTQLFISVEE
jgi:outer membrane protein TolC